MQVWPRKWKGTCLLSFEGSVCGVVNQPLKTSLVYGKYFSTNVVSKCLTLNSLSYRNLCTFLVVDSAKVSDAMALLLPFFCFSAAFRLELVSMP